MHCNFIFVQLTAKCRYVLSWHLTVRGVDHTVTVSTTLPPRLQKSIQLKRSSGKEHTEQCTWLWTIKPKKSVFIPVKVIPRVAIKRIDDVFRTKIDAKRALREIVILRHCHHPNICGLLFDSDPLLIPRGLIVPPDQFTYKSLWMVQVGSSFFGSVMGRNMAGGTFTASFVTLNASRTGARATFAPSCTRCSAVFSICKYFVFDIAKSRAATLCIAT